jgi:hypothetical protein
MTTVLATQRRLARLLGPVLGLVLATSLVVTAFHHHAESATGHACVVCSVGHAPAITTVTATGTSAPAPRAERVDAPRAQLPPAPRIAAIAARAPPSA